MKKVIFFVLSLFVMALVSCGGSENASKYANPRIIMHLYSQLKLIQIPNY